MKKGFMLVEMLVYVAVLAVIMGAVFSFLLWTAQSQLVVSSQRRLSIVASQALELVSKEAREAKGVYDPTSVFQSSPGQLSLETAKDLPEGETET
ncbi:MAG: type II secretion system protein, partial [bacterium]|nr:type II secretion system protein [bacterium]